MRNFTNASVFDDTLPVADGQMEIGSNVPLDQLRDAMEDWFRRKGYLPKESKIVAGRELKHQRRNPPHTAIPRIFL